MKESFKKTIKWIKMKLILILVFESFLFCFYSKPVADLMSAADIAKCLECAQQP